MIKIIDFGRPRKKNVPIASIKGSAPLKTEPSKNKPNLHDEFIQSSNDYLLQIFRIPQKKKKAQKLICYSVAEKRQ